MNLTGILNILNMLQSGLRFLTTRGITRDHAIALLDKAFSEDRDVSIEEVQAELDSVQDQLDATGTLIDKTFRNG